MNSLSNQNYRSNLIISITNDKRLDSSLIHQIELSWIWHLFWTITKAFGAIALSSVAYHKVKKQCSLNCEWKLRIGEYRENLDRCTDGYVKVYIQVIYMSLQKSGRLKVKKVSKTSLCHNNYLCCVSGPGRGAQVWQARLQVLR